MGMRSVFDFGAVGGAEVGVGIPILCLVLSWFVCLLAVREREECSSGSVGGEDEATWCLRPRDGTGSIVIARIDAETDTVKAEACKTPANVQRQLRHGQFGVWGRGFGFIV